MFTFISGYDSRRNMRVMRVTVVIISIIIQLTTNCIGTGRPVSMYVRLEKTGENYVHVNFYNGTFQSLYTCMRDMNSQQCFVQAAYENYETPFPGLNNKVVTVRSFGIPQLFQSSFTCLYSQQATALECTRNTGLCGGNSCTSFRLRNYPICECVDLIWQYTNEMLVFDKTDNIEYCKQDCAETTTAQSREPSIETTNVQSTEPSSYPSVTSLASEQSSLATTSTSNATNIANFGGDESSTNTVPVIIGVVLGVLFLAVIVIVVGFIYRRKKQTKRQANNNGIISSRTNTSYNNGDPVRSHVLNIPDVLSTLPYSSHAGETSRELEDGYYTIDKAYGLNRYENGLNTISSKASQRPTEGAFSSRGFNKYTNELRAPPRVSAQTLHIYEGDAGNSEVSHALEGDYFTIDTENDGQKNKPIEKALNSRHLNKHTNELRDSPQTSHTFEDDAVKSEPLHALESDYFTLETANDFGEDDTTVNVEQTIDGGYSLAKDVDMSDEAAVVDVIDVSPPPKNIYSKFGDNNTDMKNPYDTLLEKHQLLNSRKTSVDETP